MTFPVYTAKFCRVLQVKQKVLIPTKGPSAKIQINIWTSTTTEKKLKLKKNSNTSQGICCHKELWLLYFMSLFIINPFGTLNSQASEKIIWCHMCPVLLEYFYCNSTFITFPINVLNNAAIWNTHISQWENRAQLCLF